MRRSIAIILIVTSCAIEPAEFLPKMDGYVGTESAIKRAKIVAFAMDFETGKVDYSRILGTAISDEYGRFELEVADYSELVFLVAYGGVTEAFWSEEKTYLDTRGHLVAVVPYYKMTDLTRNRTHPVSVTPVTHIVYSIAAARLRLSKEDRMVDALATSNYLMQNHLLGATTQTFPCDADFSCLRPRQEHELGRLDDADMYTMALFGISATARQREYSNHNDDGRRWNSVRLTLELSLDADDNGLLDGHRDLDTTANTLRSEFGNALMHGYLETELNESGLSRDALLWDIERIATNRDPELFGHEPPEPLDDIESY